MKKRLLLLGASGSIGKQTLDVIRCHQEELELVGVSVGNNVGALVDILNEFDVKYAYCINQDDIITTKYPNVKFFFGDQGLIDIVKVEDYDMLVNALVGFVGFMPTLEAINNKKDIALANKETLVAGGDIINEALQENNVKLFPIDSEHSAILQSMQGHRFEDIRRLIITASGGAFRDYSRADLVNADLEKALQHPVWNMGAKITIDSATMMNKGFEVIEAHHLFHLPYDKIDVVIHPQSIVHSMVEYNDGSIIAQLGCPDMHLPIKYALLYPKHSLDFCSQYLDLTEVANLQFMKLDYNRFPLVRLAKELGTFGGNSGAFLNGANDEAVSLFLNNKISFVEIEEYIFNTLKDAHFKQKPTAEDLVSSHKWAMEHIDYLWANS